MLPTIDRDTRLCMSLSGRPGNVGTRFHNYLYRELGLNYVYKAFTTRDIEGAVAGIRALGIRGCAISMPFKEVVIPLIDEMTPSAAAIESVNTIVNEEGWLRAYNTDYSAVRSLIKSNELDPGARLAIRGSGGMAKAVACAFRDEGFGKGLIIARNEDTGRALAQRYGYDWKGDISGVIADIVVNVTPVGMEGGAEAEDLAFEEGTVDTARTVFDVVAMPVETPLIRCARQKGKAVITGAEVMTLQAVEQFVLYTGIRPEDELIARAQTYARTA